MTDEQHYLDMFLRESNSIEGIFGNLKPTLRAAATAFMELPKITVDDVTAFVQINEPSVRLRDHRGMNVRVGDHIAPEGGEKIFYMLYDLLVQVNNNRLHPWTAHCAYEDLHPYQDGNGRSGRMIWRWQMHQLKMSTALGFLHTFYYQTLEFQR